MKAIIRDRTDKQDLLTQEADQEAHDDLKYSAVQGKYEIDYTCLRLCDLTRLLKRSVPSPPQQTMDQPVRRELISFGGHTAKAEAEHLA